MANTDEFLLFLVVLAECNTLRLREPDAGSSLSQVVRDARKFRKIARGLETLAVAACNRIMTDKERARGAALVAEADALAAVYGATAITGGDPRGFSLKLVLPSGRYNTWGGPPEGYGVPV